MTMSTPVLVKPIKPFTPDDSYDFPFVYTSGTQAVKNNLEIQRLSDNFQVYEHTIDSFSLRHPLPANSLPSGVPYKARVRVGGINNEWSQFSDWEIFWVLEKPILNITNIDYANQNRVYSQTVTFSATYNHPDGELLQSYRYNLYDSNRNLISSYREQYSDGTTDLTQEVTGLINGELYYIELKTFTVNQQESSTELILVRPFYMSPKLTSALGVENLRPEGAIKITAHIVQIIGRLYDENGNEILKEDIEYVDGEKLDLNRPDYDKLVYDEGFDIEGDDFVLKVWCENIPDNEVFMRLYSSYGWINFVKYDDKIHLFKYLYNIKYPSHFTSNEIIVSQNQAFMIYVKAINHSFDIVASVI